MELSGELGILAAFIAAGTIGLLAWRRAAALLWKVYLEEKVKELLEEHDECDEAHRLDAVRSGIAANGTAISRLQDASLDTTQLRRLRRFFEGNGTSELYELVKKVDRLQADQQQDRSRLELCLEKIDAFRMDKARRDQDTETDLTKLVKELREQLGLTNG